MNVFICMPVSALGFNEMGCHKYNILLVVVVLVLFAINRKCNFWLFYHCFTNACGKQSIAVISTETVGPYLLSLISPMVCNKVSVVEQLLSRLNGTSTYCWLSRLLE